MRRISCVCLWAWIMFLPVTAEAFREVQAEDVLPEDEMPAMIDVPEGAVSWQLLQKTFPVEASSGREEDQTTGYDDAILALDGKRTTFYGYIIITDLERLGYEQKEFLLAAYPPHCPYCLNGRPENLIRVTPEAPVKIGYVPALVEGRFNVAKDSPWDWGDRYILTDAKIIKMD